MGGKVVFFTALFVAAVVSGRAAAACKFIQVAELPVTMVGLQPTIEAKVNGVDAVLETDTGAFFSMLSTDAAKRFKLFTRALPGGFYLRGVVGEVRPDLGEARTFGLAGATLKSVQFLIAGDQRGRIDGLLGQNVLGRYDTEVDLANGVIRLFHPEGCGDKVLAYWAKDLPIGSLPIEPMTDTEPHVVGQAQVNGHNIRVTFDTGANLSSLRPQAARNVGLDLSAPGVRAGGLIRGIGPRQAESWIVPVDSFSIGDETIKHTSLRVARDDIDTDMLLGADFFLSHRVLISRSQRRVYFTYNGGPVFRLDETPLRGQPVAAAPAPAGETSSAGLDAGALVRRAMASAARGELASALADLSRAIELEPDDPRHHFDRALVRMRARQPVLAMGDLDQAIRLKPDLTEALMLRGRLRLGAGDETAADADFQAALKTTLDDLRTGAQIAATYAGASRFERAVGYYDGVIGRHPDAPDLGELLNGRCWARALWGRELDKALADCDAAVRRWRNAQSLDSRGLAHLRRGEFDLATADYDAALKLQPKQAWSLFGRGLAKAKKGDAAGGAADLSEAEALAPDIRAQAKRYGITEQTVVALQAPQS